VVSAADPLRSLISVFLTIKNPVTLNLLHRINKNDALGLFYKFHYIH
jgi:hypothetical protein